MTFIGIIFITLAKILHLIVNLYSFIVLGAVIISWVRPDPSNPIVRFLIQTTEPVFKLVRSRLPKSFMTTGLDFTPIIVFVILIIIDTFVSGTLMEIGIQLRHNPTSIINSIGQDVPNF